MYKLSLCLIFAFFQGALLFALPLEINTQEVDHYDTPQYCGLCGQWHICGVPCPPVKNK